MESKEDNPSFKSVSHKRLSKSSSVNQTESPKKRPSGVFMKKCAQMSLQEGNLTVKRRVQTKAEPTVKPTKTIELVAEQPHSAEADKTASGKKVKGKGRKKIKRKARKIPPPKEKDHRENALEYVKLWNSNREHWSFKKKYQIWLLKNMYDKSKIPKAAFKLLLNYLKGIQGHSRADTIRKAQLYVDNYCCNNNTEKECQCSKLQYKRAVEVLRTVA